MPKKDFETSEYYTRWLEKQQRPFQLKKGYHDDRKLYPPGFLKRKLKRQDSE